jgi:hypothetical protein
MRNYRHDGHHAWAMSWPSFVASTTQGCSSGAKALVSEGALTAPISCPPCAALTIESAISTATWKKEPRGVIVRAGSEHRKMQRYSACRCALPISARGDYWSRPMGQLRPTRSRQKKRHYLLYASD